MSTEIELPETIEKIVIPGDLLLERESYERICAECLATGHKETGGVLVGRRIEFEGCFFIVVVYASGPGPAARHEDYHFAPDITFIQAELDRVHTEYAQLAVGVNYIGEWHKHPSGMPRLSDGDLRQAEKILQDPDYRLEWGELVLPIAVVQTREVSFNPYYLSRLHPEPVPLRFLLWEREGLNALLKEVA